MISVDSGSSHDFKKIITTSGKVELQFKNKNGARLYLIGAVAIGESDQFRFLGVDVTELKAELQARIDIMNQTSIVSEANLRGDILTVNDKFIQVSKYSKDELIGKPHNTTRTLQLPERFSIEA